MQFHPIFLSFIVHQKKNKKKIKAKIQDISFRHLLRILLCFLVKLRTEEAHFYVNFNLFFETIAFFWNFGKESFFICFEWQWLPYLKFMGSALLPKNGYKACDFDRSKNLLMHRVIFHFLTFHSTKTLIYFLLLHKNDIQFAF